MPLLTETGILRESYQLRAGSNWQEFPSQFKFELHPMTNGNVTCQPERAAPSSDNPSRKRKRRISFEMDELGCDRIIPAKAHQTVAREQKTALWYSRGELKSMKISARNVSRRKDLEMLINDAYCQQNAMKNRLDSGHPTQVMDDGDASKCMLLDQPLFHEQRGMERVSSQRYAVSRVLTILQVKTEVYLAQAKQPLGQSNLEESIAGICEAASQPAVRFARLLGELDERAARQA